jgi:hypothetical protein
VKAVLIILLFCQVTQAQSNAYLTAAEMKAKGIDVSQPSRAMTAIEVDDGLVSRDFQKNCTGFFVSRLGYVIAPLHCVVHACLDEDTLVNSTRKTGFGAAIVDVGDKLKGKRCRKVGVTTQEGTVGNATVVASGRAVYDISKKFDEMNRKKFESASLEADKIEDYAVLKIPDFKVTEGIGCVSINDMPLPVGETIWTYRYEGVKEPARQFALGKRLSGSEVGHLINSKNVFSDMKLERGNRGGPVIDEYGDVRGMVTQTYESLAEIYPIKEVREGLRKQLSAKEFEEVFNCPKVKTGGISGSVSGSVSGRQAK